MDYSRSHNGWVTIAEHLGFVPAIGLAFLISVLHWNFTFWFVALVTSFALMFVGGVLITRAKFPIYRKGQFFMFGIKSVPVELRSCYRIGGKLVLIGILLSVVLLLSHP